MAMKIDDHIIDEKILKPNDWILDAGCRHFGLKAALKGEYNWLCLDADDNIKPPTGVTFKQVALMAYEGNANYCGWSTGEGNYCYTDKAPHYADKDLKIECTTIEALMKANNIKQFGLIKLDIEGAEYDVLLSINSPVAKQIAVEFHQCLGYNKHGTHDEYIAKLMASDFGKHYEIKEFYENESCKGLYEYNFKLK